MLASTFPVSPGWHAHSTVGATNYYLHILETNPAESKTYFILQVKRLQHDKTQDKFREKMISDFLMQRLCPACMFQFTIPTAANRQQDEVQPPAACWSLSPV